MKKALIISTFFLGMIAAIPALAATSESQVQSGINPQTFVNTIQKALTFPALNLKNIPSALSPVQLNNVSVQSLLPADSSLQNLNQQIKQSVGIDIPVFLQAIINGIVWLLQQVFGFLQRIAS